MRVLVDTNLLISYLLVARSVPAHVITAEIESNVELMVSALSISELQDKCREKPYLSSRIPEQAVQSLVWLLEESATILPVPDTLLFERYTHDPKDDYLIAHALAEEVDVLVSGDRDLLALDGTFSFRILSPSHFVALLEGDVPDPACEPTLRRRAEANAEG